MSNYVSYGLEKKITQMIFPRLNVNEWEEKKNFYIKLAELGVGGFCVFFGDIDKMREIAQELNKHAEIPLLFACDMEHGMAMRFPDATAFPRAGAIANSKNPGNAYICSKITALEAKSCGIFWNLAPVADINSNPNNPIINIRAYGSNPINVSAYINAYIDAAKSERMLTCLKHFPGHGDTDIDSHISLPTINATMAELTRNELVPFFAGIKNGVPSIMLGHLAVPAIDESNTPASLSSKVVELLREKMKFDGIIVTDALEMHSVEKAYPNGEATFMAMTAGADVLLMPENPVAAMDYILNHISEVNDTQISASFHRIINQKRWCGLLDGIMDSLPTASFQEHREMAIKMAKSTIQITADKPTAELEKLYQLEEEDSFLLLSILLDDRNLSKAMEFAQLLQSMTANNCDTMFINNALDADGRNLLSEAASENNTIILAVYQSPSSFSVQAKISEELLAFINTLSAGKKSIVVNFGPSSACAGLSYCVKLDAFSDDSSSMFAVSNFISGSDEDLGFASDVNLIQRNP